MYSPGYGFDRQDRPLAHSTPKVCAIIHFPRAHFENYYNHSLKVETVNSDWPFWASRWGFALYSKPTAKPKRKSKLCPQRGILCPRSRLKIVLSDIEFERRLWFEHLCAKCACGVHFYFSFIVILDVNNVYVLLTWILWYLLSFGTLKIAISRGFYKELLHFLERFWGVIFHGFAGVEIITMFCYSLYAKRFLN